MLTGLKPLLASRTIAAAFIGLVFALLDAFGVDAGVSEGEALEAVYKLVEVLAFLVAIWGRVVATKRLA